jgi:hypothetical protein
MLWPQFPTKTRVTLNSDNRVGVILNSFNEIGFILNPSNQVGVILSGAAWGPAQRGKQSEASPSSFEGLQPLTDVFNVPNWSFFTAKHAHERISPCETVKSI